jgi:PAS domain S-box-containing protein
MKTGIITSANSFAERVLGYKSEEVANKLNFIELIHPDDHERLFCRLHELAQEKNRKPNFPARLLRADGEVIDVEINGNVINDSDGNPDTFVGVIRDVTERKIVESALRESEQRYRTVVDSSLTGISLIQDGEYKFVNERLCEMSGYSREELLKMTFRQIIHPDDIELAQEALTKRLSKEDSGEHFQFRALVKNGDIRWVETLGTEVEYQGKPAVLVNVIDITDRRKAEDERRWFEDRYRALFEESKDCVFVSTPDGRFLDINAAGVEMYGYSSKDELLKVDIVNDLYTNPGQPKEIETILAERGYVKDYEFTYKRKDGRIINVLETVTTVRDENGDIVAYRGIQRDITEQKQLQEQLLQAQKMESIGTLAGGIAHDFNNLLGGILGYASLMKTKLPEGHQIYQYADTVERSATRAAELTAQLLAFARGGKYEMRIIDLNAIVNETLGIIGRTFDKSIDIETHLDEQLPTIEADAGQIQQVLMNLCVNGRDAMNGHGRLIIETKVETITEEYVRAHMNAVMGTCVVLSVTDTGSGMNEEIVERIFEPFFTTKPEGEGTGLGLSMVYGVVKNHDGYVRVYSEPGEGSTFKVYLPVNGKPKAREKQECGAIDNGSGLVLVVDDEASIRSLARDILESYGYNVLLAEDGPEAIKLYSERGDEIDLVILDMVMPKMSGRETFAKLKDLNPSVKALLSTGYSQNGKAKGILESGVMAFVQKPYNVNALLSEVKSVLHRKL